MSVVQQLAGCDESVSVNEPRQEIGSVKVVLPSASAASEVTSLKIEPGESLVEIARL